MIAALATGRRRNLAAGLAGSRPQRLRRRLAQMSDGERLFHSWRAGRRLPMAFLDDYAQMSRAALALFHEQTGDWAYLERACAWVERCRGDFHDKAGGGYFLSRGRPTARSSGRRTRTTDPPLPPTAPSPGSPPRSGTLPATEPTARWPRTSLGAFAGGCAQAPPAMPRCCWRPPYWPSRCRSWSWATTTTPGFAACSPRAAGRRRPARSCSGRARTAPAGEPSGGGKRLLDGRAAAYVCIGSHLRSAAHRSGSPDANGWRGPQRHQLSTGRDAWPTGSSSISTGGPEVLQYESYDVAAPGPGEALVRHDGDRPQFHRRLFPHRPLPGAAAAHARAWKAPASSRRSGRRHRPRTRAARGLCRRRRSGAYADIRVMPADSAGAAARRHLLRYRGRDDAQGHDRAIPAARRPTACKPGDTILFHAAAGGVGPDRRPVGASIWARRPSARSARAEKAELARAHGYEHVIDYQREDFVARVKRNHRRRGRAGRL